MIRISFYIVYCIAVVALWPVTEANTGRTTRPPSTTFNPKRWPTPCDGVTCPPRKHCALNENNQALCVCSNCYDSYDPVCGSDNRTYSSDCELNRVACKTNSNLTVNHYRECHKEGSVCYGITCPAYKVCAVAGDRATCVCSGECSTDSYAVCGSDNQTYINDCDLRRHSCVTNVNITRTYYGECKQASVCDGFSCSKGMQCAIDEKHKPVCVCGQTCPDSTETVCGSDGWTYGSECELFREACNSVTDIRVASKGYCLKGSVCDGHRCPSDRQCNVDQYNRPVCFCPQRCIYENNPVCGSNGVTYFSLCELKRQACITGKNITVARTGRCIYYDYCNSVTCRSPKTCVVDENNGTSCVCYNNCGDEYNPVCGSDNKTYDGYCQYLYAACQANISNATYYTYSGVCSEGSNCERMRCPSGSHCVSSQYQPEPKCVCDTFCPTTYSPVCGSNNKTYNNSCELKKDACLTNTTIWQEFNGRCDEGLVCKYTYCPGGRTCVVDEHKRPRCVCSQYCSGGSREVCGSDNKTYSSSCLLAAAACMTNTSIYEQRSESCAKGGPCDGIVCSSDRYCDLSPKRQPVCVCNEDCNSYGSPVCGSDNRTYSNYCQLRKHACLSSTSILWLYYGKCVEASVCDKACPPDKRCAVDERNQPTCVCIDECLGVQYPVCGSDGRTYANECELQKTACLENRNTTLAHRGKCDQGLTCRDVSCTTGRICALNEGGRPTCVCDTKCEYYSNNPVCGSDRKTYDNECYLKSYACTTDTDVKVNYNGACTKDASTSKTSRRPKYPFTTFTP